MVVIFLLFLGALSHLLQCATITLLDRYNITNYYYTLYAVTRLHRVTSTFFCMHIVKELNIRQSRSHRFLKVKHTKLYIYIYLYKKLYRYHLYIFGNKTVLVVVNLTYIAYFTKQII